MSQEIELWGGQNAKQGVLTIYPLSDEAKATCVNMSGYIKEFPKVSYATDWGDWDSSNSQWITSKIKTIAGGDESVPGKIVQMLGGQYYKPPILTDKWTQIAAQLSDDAYIKFDFEILAYPTIPKSSVGAHVEGLRYDRDNMYPAITYHDEKLSSMWDWMNLGKTAMMPATAFSTGIVKDNIAAMKKNLEEDNGKLILGGIKDVGSAAVGVFSDFNEAAKKGLDGLEKVAAGVMGVGQRLGHTFCMSVTDPNGAKFIDSRKPSMYVDFYIKKLTFEFSPHIVRIIDGNGKRVGACPEYCKIEMSLESVTKVSPSQMIDMFKYEYKE